MKMLTQLFYINILQPSVCAFCIDTKGRSYRSEESGGFIWTVEQLSIQEKSGDKIQALRLIPAEPDHQSSVVEGNKHHIMVCSYCGNEAYLYHGSSSTIEWGIMETGTVEISTVFWQNSGKQSPSILRNALKLSCSV